MKNGFQMVGGECAFQLIEQQRILELQTAFELTELMIKRDVADVEMLQLKLFGLAENESDLGAETVES